MPVALGEEILGVMRVYTTVPRRFSEQDIDFVSTAANIGAKALEDAANGKFSELDYDTFRLKLLELEWARWPGQCP